MIAASAIGEEAVIADAMEARGQDVKQEAADELIGRDGHDLLPIAVPIVLPAETNGAILDIDKAVVGDGDAVRVAADVIEDLFGSAEGRLGIDHPLGLSKGRQIAPEGVALAQGIEAGEELQLTGGEGFLQAL